MDLVVEVYKNSVCFPKEETYGLRLQMRKAAVSMPSNISEGAGRNSDAQFQHFLEIAMASSNELQTQLELARRLEYLADDIALRLIDEALQIYKMTLTLYYKLGGEPFEGEVKKDDSKTSDTQSAKFPEESSNIRDCLGT